MERSSQLAPDLPLHPEPFPELLAAFSTSTAAANSPRSLRRGGSPPLSQEPALQPRLAVRALGNPRETGKGVRTPSRQSRLGAGRQGAGTGRQEGRKSQGNDPGASETAGYLLPLGELTTLLANITIRLGTCQKSSHSPHGCRLLALFHIFIVGSGNRLLISAPQFSCLSASVPCPCCRPQPWRVRGEGHS